MFEKYVLIGESRTENVKPTEQKCAVCLKHWLLNQGVDSMLESQLFENRNSDNFLGH